MTDAGRRIRSARATAVGQILDVDPECSGHGCDERGRGRAGAPFDFAEQRHRDVRLLRELLLGEPGEFASSGGTFSDPGIVHASTVTQDVPLRRGLLDLGGEPDESVPAREIFARLEDEHG